MNHLIFDSHIVLGKEKVASLGAQLVKESACTAGDLRSIPGLGGSPWRRERLTYSRILAWRILQSMGSQRVGRD